MRIAFGALQWTPDVFWRSTLTEFIEAVEAFNERNGGEKNPEAPTDDEMAELLARYGRS